MGFRQRMKIDFNGQAGIVSGAGRGMGRAFALDLARRGAAVVVNGRPPDQGGGGEVEAVAEEIVRSGGRAVLVYKSIDNPDAADALIGVALGQFGSVDFVINNAGILRNGTYDALSPRDLDNVLDVHLRGTFFLGQRAFAAMKARGYGRIVNVSSTTALVGIPGLANYAAAKGGVLGLTRAMAAEGVAHGIAVNALVPSALGKMQAQSPIPGFAARFDAMRETLRPRMAPESVAPLATFLASSACERNGEIWTACAGRFARVATCFAQGWMAPDADAVTAEDIADHIAEIAAIEGGAEPTSLDDIYRDIIERLPRS
jgi:NAD(P)-dependent dehydrogenase (short-subunit alcohol dehydrogenase family)